MADRDGDGYRVRGHDLAHVRNYSELRVIEALREALPRQAGFCGCTLCVQDVYALTMNRIPAHYIQSGAILLHPEATSRDDIESYLRDAFERVRAHPKHPR
ncbi:MAG: late competence development ComFB family protein [Candidatus Lambdaproteobacteria bacterium]|nr:late competence development ComFB family protein [Candidatus Lambdaproteobacteria bacterium]